MGYLDIYGRANGYIRINYTESLNKSAKTSTVTISSVQVCSTNRYQYTFMPFGKISLGNQTINLTGDNGVYVGAQYTLTSFSNVPSISATFPNDGSGRQAAITLSAAAGYNDFNILCYSASSGNIEIDTGTRYINLSTYETDTPSTISAPSSVTLGDSANITISAAKTSYTHTVQYSFDNSSWTNIVTGCAGGSFSWDTSDVSSYFVNATSKTCYLRCITYRSGTQIGSPSSTSILITASGVPEINDLTVNPVNNNATIKSWNDGDIFVQGYTKAKINVGYSLPPGAGLRSCKILVNGITVSDDTSTEATTPEITDAGAVNISVFITDTRGGTASKSATVNVYPYSRPYATQADAIRYSTNADTEDKENGTNISAKATISYSNVNGYNSAGIKVQYKAAGGVYQTSSTALTSGNANYVKINSNPVDTATSYIVQFIIYDSLHTENSDPTTVEVIIPTKAVTIHAKDGGDGIALGGYNTLDAIELWLDTYLYGKLVVPSSMYGADEPSTSGAVVGQVYFQLVD